MGVGVAFDGGGHGQEGVGEHGQGGPAVPGSSSAGPGVDRARPGLWRLGRIPRCASVGRPRRPGCAAAPGVGCSSAGRRARRWRRCGGSANDGRRCRCRLRPAAETRPRSTAVGRGLRRRRSVSARRVAGSARAARRRGSGRRGWVHAGWPRSPAHSPGRDRERRRAAAGRRHRLRRRPPTPREPRRDCAVDQRRGQCGLGRESLCLLSGIPASSQRSESSVHDLGRYRARSIRACPRGAA